MNKALPSDLPPLALIAGPTASGKSALALRIAEESGGVVINADASQVYADLRILTARPTPEEEARAPHRLFGHVDGADACSAARWAAEAKQAISEAHSSERLPVLVGGTGLYIRTLLDGLAPVPEVAEAVRSEVRALPVAEAHRALSVEDPPAAARLGPADTSRVARALEVVRGTGRSLLEWQRDRSGGIAGEVALRALVIDPPADRLYARCEARLNIMLAGGALDEVARLLRRELPSELPVMRAIGVSPLARHLGGEISLDEARAEIAQATRNYAKRQRTWARNQYPQTWPRVPSGDVTASLRR